MMKIEKNWHTILKEEFQSRYIKELKNFLEEEEAKGEEVFPPKPLIFQAFAKTSWSDLRVVIVGQDPYHAPGQASGLSFSVPDGVKPPPSLQNIFKEVERDTGKPKPKSGCLERWAKQGVLLLNTVLTVRRFQPQSHAGRGWEQFTDAVIEKIAKKKTPMIFILWGKSAQKKCEKLCDKKFCHHIILKASHPSPYSASRGFFGCSHFSKTNKALISLGTTPIDW